MASPAPPSTTAPKTAPGPNGPHPIRKIRRATGDPLVRPKPRKPPPKKAPGPAPAATKPAVKEETEPDDDPSTYIEYKLVTTKKALLRNMRFHCMRLYSKNEVNIMDPEEFIRPIKLHRRDPRGPLQGGKIEPGSDSVMLDPDEKDIDPEEKAKREAEKAEKERQQAENLARIAPHGGAVKQKKNMFKKKTQQVFQRDEEERRLKYEEYFPWFIEDYENKNTWIGNLEGGLSGTSVMLVMDEGMFKMIPVEKFYRFQPRNTFKTLSADQAEAAMKQKERLNRWFMDVTKTEEKEAKMKEERENMRATKRLYTVKGDRLEGREAKPGFTDADELDFEEDFADDEAPPIIEGDEEELKSATKKMQREQLSANIFDIRDEKDYEREETEKLALEKSRKDHGRKVKKYLKQREKNLIYDTDSDENPYASSEESVDSDEEAAKKEEEEKRKAAEKAAKDKEEEERKRERQEQKEAEEAMKSLKAAAAGKAAAQPGTSSSTTTAATTTTTTTTTTNVTPPSTTTTTTTTPNKHPTATAKTLKRSGSPGAADSGAESAQPSKRIKKEDQPATGKSLVTANGQGPNPNSRLITIKRDPDSTVSPPPVATKGKNPKKRRNPIGAGSGSEYETGGEMSDGAASDGGKAAKRVRQMSTDSTSSAPVRSGSPPGKPGTLGKKSRSGSPDASAQEKSKGTITEEEIKAVLTPEGIDFATISKKFHGRVNPGNKAEFFKKLKGLSRLVDDRERGKVFYPREEAT
ncbi:Transcription initiation factor [Drechslerella dactyloides]|uniref:Transcription initiation factor IIF subunit alpha n=1 Tax=Drechslerella dactyloides TaxID=74499 RepID=A0AAD6J2Y5_DREDA|nr:Transcription initiation factor [Drechslerella dactyloides]